MLNRVSLNTIGLNRIGLNRIGKPSRGSSERPYIDPEVLASLKAVCICYGKSNDDPDRAIVKNLVDASNPFIISNAAFKLNSGFGLYAADFLDWTSPKDAQKTSFEVKITSSNYKENWVAYKAPNTTFKAMKVRISGIPDGGALQFFRKTADGGGIKMVNGINEIPAFTNTVAAGFYIDIPLGFDWSNLVIEQIPSFEGAFVTDGIDDLITSTKTVQEMLGGSNEITVVSMWANLGDTLNTVNTIRGSVPGYCQNIATSNSLNNKYYIAGYSGNVNSNITMINPLLGDQADWIVRTTPDYVNSIFNVEGFRNSAGSPSEVSQIAWYWTIIANKVLTTDQINQVIAYFNLDRTLKPDILCNTIKQGITNENHAEFGDKLIDYSGNGRDIQLNNLVWDGDSGIGKYNYPGWKLTANKAGKYRNIRIYQTLNGTYTAKFEGVTELYNRVGIELEILSKNRYVRIKEDGIYSVDPVDDATELQVRFGNYTDTELYDCDITITQIPSHAGALCLDGINDFGKVTGMPIYKDYTLIVDREIESINGSLLSKSQLADNGAFIFEYYRLEQDSTVSFGYLNSPISNLSRNRKISYQSKYSYNGVSLSAGTITDSTTMYLGTIREGATSFSKSAIYSLMSFPYSMSEFLIERQLKKYKLGTLYLDMVEFRPVINSNVLLDAKPTFVIRGTSTYLNAGDYVPENSQIWVSIKMNNAADRITKFTVNGKTIDIPENAYSEVTLQYGFPFVINKSPQKIGITIEQDEKYVQWNPVVNITGRYSHVTYSQLNDNGVSWNKLEIGEYIPIGKKVLIQITLDSNVDEISSYNVIGLTNIVTSNNDTFITGNVTSKSPQKINITIDEYIRYEDIDFSTAYPFVPLLQGISWGDKLKVGDEVTFIGFKNILPDLYIRTGEMKLNGNDIVGNSSVIVEKSMKFEVSRNYTLDNNEPNCILSPRLLRIPNSSYKILGHIPDISGHSNHGVIHNSAYAGMSGANGYNINYTTWLHPNGVEVTDSIVRISKGFNASQLWICYVPASTVIPKHIINISGVPEGGVVRLEGIGIGNGIDLHAGENIIDSFTAINASGYQIRGINLDWSNLVIEQIGEYEGAYCFDGVDDFVTIPTLSSGGKQVLMKVNQSNVDSCLYTQVSAGIGQDRMTTSLPTSLAYQGKWEITNWDKVYIDGIENNNITNEQLYDITHIITAISRSSVETLSPIIGALRVDNTLATFAKMALYDFMLFDEISTEDKIKELNEYVGIEGNVWGTLTQLSNSTLISNETLIKNE